MDWNSFPTPLVAASLAILAAVITGFFSIVNLVSSKENKVSEFRLAWIDGLRDEVASYIASLQDLSRLEKARLNITDSNITTKEWLELNGSAFNTAVSSLTKIQLRLNPKHLNSDDETPERTLIVALHTSRDRFGDGDYDGALESSQAIRDATGPLLKATWNEVKLGERGYRRIRQIAIWFIVTFMITLSASILYIIASMTRQDVVDKNSKTQPTSSNVNETINNSIIIIEQKQ